MTWIRLSLLSFLVLVGIQCLGIKKHRMAIIEGIASQSLSDIILLPSSPTIVSYSVPAGTSATIVNPDPERTELQTMLHNTNANLRLNLILKERLSVSGFSKLALDKNIEFTNYLRRRIIQEMIQRGIR